MSMSGSGSRFPPDSRVFVGNLAADKTSVAELEGLFRKYGRLGEPPILRRSFGFVQYEESRSAQDAVRALNGAMVGGLTLDLSIADNRPVRAKDGFPADDRAPAPRSDRLDARPVKREREREGGREQRGGGDMRDGRPELSRGQMQDERNGARPRFNDPPGPGGAGGYDGAGGRG
ncbi:hypothetical protein T484DRAFT_1882565, partial [Baffinella frigidus]